MKKFIPLLFFGIAMAYIESAVVVYLRKLYYPEGFAFPLKVIPMPIGLIEVGREAATILMLLTITLIAGKNKIQRIAYFIFLFGVWDIFYYLWLKIFLSWPPSIFTWDILFLIPVVWTGPVIAPIIVSISLIISALIIIHLDERKYTVSIKKLDWIIVSLGAVIIFISFILDYLQILKGDIPHHYHWELLAIGELMGFGVLFNIYKNAVKIKVY